MNQEGSDDGRLRKYLLSQLNEAEQQLLEEKLLTEDELLELLDVVEDELIDDYLSGLLSVDERNKFENLFLSTPGRRRKLNFAMSLREYVSAEQGAAQTSPVGIQSPLTKIKRSPFPWRHAFTTPSLRLAAATLLVLALALGIWRIVFHQSQVSKGVASLREAYRDQRPTEARISGLIYAPPRLTTRGAEQDKFDYVALDRAKALIQLEAGEHPSAQSFHDLGRLYLSQGDFDKAIDQFEKALKLDEKSAELHSDYGAALLEKGKTYLSKGEAGRSLEQFAKSLEYLMRSLELDGSLLDALFNRALCHEYMMLPPDQLEKDWGMYLDKDSNSQWADEARRRRQELLKQSNKISQTKESLYQQFLIAYQVRDRSKAWAAFSMSRARVGNTTTEMLIDNYLEEFDGSLGQRSKEMYDPLAYAGHLDFETVGDRFTLDLAQFYASIGPGQRAILKKARQLSRVGQVQIAQSKFKMAFETYTEAQRAFDRAGDKCESKSADYWLAVCYLQEIDPQRSVARFHEIAADCEKNDYNWLVIRSLNGIAHRNEALNEYSRVILYSNRSLRLAEQAQDAYGSVFALLYLTRAYSYLGNQDESLDCLQRLLRLAADSSMEPVQICVCYARAAWTLYREGFQAASLDYQKLALEHSLNLNERTMICTSYVNLGMIEAKLNNVEAALADVRKAVQIAQAQSGDTPGLLMMAYSSLNLGSILRQTGELRDAVESYSQSIDIYNKMDYPSFIHEAHKGLLLCLIASGDTPSAKAELGKAISYYEDNRSRIEDQNSRNTFFDLEQDIYDLAIDFEYSLMNAPKAAFEYSELSRARSLRDLMLKDNSANEKRGNSGKEVPANPLTLSQIQERLPDQIQVVQYAVLEDKLLVWLFTRTSFETATHPISSKELGDIAKKYSDLISLPKSEGTEIYRLASELHELLIGPIEPFLDKDKQLFIVPDKFLNDVSFQSLISATTGNYLLEDYRLALSPSSSVLIECSETALSRGKREAESALTVGLSRFAHRLDDDLPDLLSATREARVIADSYVPSLCLTGDRATKNEVLRQMKTASVIHLASHFVRNDALPLKSRLLLTDDHGIQKSTGAPNNALEASEVYNLKLPLAKLLVLSACRTGIEKYYRGEGAISIAHAFIAARVPVVVASLWAVDSDSTTQLMIDFHSRRREKGITSAEALRRAQLAMLNGGEARYTHPYYWASFNLIGGYSNY